MKRITLFFVLASAFLSLNCVKSFAKEVTLVYTGETHAMLYPCHCPLEPDGGVARRATLLRQLRKSSPNLLLLDSGNFSSGGLLDQNTQNTQLDMQRAKINLKAMELMQYDALNLGDDEFNFGEDFFAQNAADLKLKFISANIKSQKASPYIIKEASGVKIGITGLANPKVKDKLKGSALAENKAALKEAVSELKAKGAQVVVLLSNLGEEEDLKIVSDIPGIDVVIDGRGPSKKGIHFKSGDTIFLRPSWQGRKLGKAVLSIADKGVASYKAEEIRVSDKLADGQEVLSILPRCFSDGDCRKSGLVGTCESAGNTGARCLFSEASKVKLTVIMPKECATCDAEPTVSFLRKQFPGLEPAYLYYPQGNTARLIKELGVSGLPVYLLGKEAAREQSFDNLKKDLEDKGDYFMLKPEVSGVAYFPGRKKEKGRLDLFISLYDKGSAELLKVIAEFNPAIHLVAIHNAGKFDAPKGSPEIEEDLRAVCVKKYHPGLFTGYITCRAENILSSWWDDCLKGVDYAKIKSCARSAEGEQLLEENIRINSELKVMFGPTYLLDNQEVFSSKGVPTKDELKKILKR
jgi:5'-nucleotidase